MRGNKNGQMERATLLELQKRNGRVRMEFALRTRARMDGGKSTEMGVHKPQAIQKNIKIFLQNIQLPEV